MFFCFQWTTLLGPSQKSNTFDAPQIDAFTTNKVCGNVSFNSLIYKYKLALLAKGYETNCGVIENILDAHSLVHMGCMLPHFIA
jgi:hypothetical protein